MFGKTSFLVISDLTSFIFYIFFFTALHHPLHSLSSPSFCPSTPQQLPPIPSEADMELNEMDYEREEEEEELRKLEKPLSVLQCNHIQERRRLAEEKRMEKTRELELKSKAAIFA